MSPHLPPSLLRMLRPTSPDCSDKSTSDRHFVTWTDQEDEILRQAVTSYGIDNRWSVIAAQFSNKTSRQCRRRWHTYLSTDCKKGGWSPEEDQLLLEAHGKFGNRWTEIAKVVPGRTDNAVKNRFCALGKKQAKKSGVLFSQSSVEEGKTTSKRKVLEQNSNITNKRSRGHYGQFPPCHNTLQQQKQSHIQVKKSLQTWTIDQSMAHRAHPVHNEKTPKDVSYSTDKTLQHSKAMQSKRASKFASGLPLNKSSSKNEGFGTGALPSPLENVSSPRLAALTKNAALLDSLVMERRDARLKVWASTDDTWKSFDWFTMEEGGEVLQAASYASGHLPLGDVKDVFYEGKENYIDLSQSSYGSQITVTLPIGQEPVHQHKHQHDFGVMTPTVQHERSWKVRSEHEGLDCSSPGNAVSYQAEDSTPLQNDCFSSAQVDQSMPTDHEVERGVSCSTRCQGLKVDEREGYGSTALMSSTFCNVSSPIDFTWDSQFLMDDMPSPQFSDSEKQFLLSALDSSYQHSILESHVLGSNISMASFCTS